MLAHTTGGELNPTRATSVKILFANCINHALSFSRLLYVRVRLIISAMVAER